MELAIVDDLKNDCRNLAKIISEFLKSRQIICPIQIFTSGEEFLDNFNPDRYLAVFLDIYMDGISGMETARQIRKYSSRTAIIFVTAEDRFALEGYRVQAMDYLVKPICVDQVYSIMERLINRSRLPRYLQVTENRLPRHILLDDVLYARSVGHFLEIHLENGQKCRSYMTLDSFLQQIYAMEEPGENLLRLQFPVCCRGYTVNLEKVIITEAENFLLKDGIRIPISRPKRKKMQKNYADFIFTRTRKKI